MLKYEQFNFASTGKKLSHLNENKLVELVNEYYDTRKKASKIVEEYRLTLTPSELVRNFPMLYSEDTCPNCNNQLSFKLLSRDQQKRAANEIYCLNCGHKSRDCSCDYCTNQSLTEVARKKSLIEKVYNLENVDFKSLKDLSLRDLLDLFSLSSIIESDNKNIITNLDKVNIKFDSKMANSSFIKSLFERGLIVPSPTSSIESFADDDFPNTFFITKVEYIISVQDFYNLKSINDLFRKDDLVDMVDVLYDYWQRLSYQECLDFLLERFQGLNLKFSPGEKTRQIIEKLLKYYSTSEIQMIIYSAIHRSYGYAIENKIPKYKIANTCITSLDSYAENAITNQWTIKTNNRKIELAKVSEIFFYTLTNLGIRGYTQKPNKEILLNSIIDK